VEGAFGKDGAVVVAHSQDLALLLETSSPSEVLMAQELLDAEGIGCLVEGLDASCTAVGAPHRYGWNPSLYVSRASEGRARAVLAAAWGRLEGTPKTSPGGTQSTTVLFLVACLAAMVGLVVWTTR